MSSALGTGVKTIGESGCAATNGSESPSRGQQPKEAVSSVWIDLCYLFLCPTQASRAANASQWRKLCPYDALCCLPTSLQSFRVSHGAALEPHRDVMGDDTFHGAVIEGQQQFLGQNDFPPWPQKLQSLLCFCASVRYVPRNSISLTLSSLFRFFPPPPKVSWVEAVGQACL